MFGETIEEGNGTGGWVLGETAEEGADTRGWLLGETIEEGIGTGDCALGEGGTQVQTLQSQLQVTFPTVVFGNPSM